MKIQNDYSLITETPGDRVTPEQVLRCYQRYFFAARHCLGKDVLEIACGGGPGLGLLADVANSVVAVDCNANNLHRARSTFSSDPKIRILEGNAQNLMFQDRSFDVVILFEAIYYLSEPEQFLRECRRVLREGGLLIIGSANKEWSDFNPSAFSTRYFSATELMDIMNQHGFKTDLFKGFNDCLKEGILSKAMSLAKRTAVRLHLIPKSMRYKKFLKRIFVGRLVPLPHRLTPNLVEYHPPAPLDLNNPDRRFKVIYAVGKLRSAET